jgi:hypothetical protein
MPPTAAASRSTFRRAPIALGVLLLTAGTAVVVLVSSARASRPSSSILPEPVATAPSPAVVEEDLEPPLPDVPIGPPRPPHKVLLSRSRVTPAITRAALDLLGRPMGSEVVRTLDDRDYAFVVERHYHSPESGLTPVGWHKGVTVYALEE